MFLGCLPQCQEHRTQKATRRPKLYEEDFRPGPGDANPKTLSSSSTNPNQPLSVVGTKKNPPDLKERTRKERRARCGTQSRERFIVINFVRQNLHHLRHRGTDTLVVAARDSCEEERARQDGGQLD